MDATPDLCKARCPKCQHLISISVGRFRGGINDRGGWIVQCGSCQTTFPYHVINPDDASRILDGGKVLASWDDDVPGNYDDTLAQYGLKDSPTVQPELLVREVQATDEELDAPGMRLFDRSTIPLFTCTKCGQGVEDAAYMFLKAKMPLLVRELASFLNYHLKSGEPYEQIIVNGLATCQCGTSVRTAFAKVFSEATLLSDDPEEYCLVEVEGAVSTSRIDGIFTRNDCLALLEKLLERWRVIHSIVVVAVPFIGFEYPNSAKKRVALWNRLLRHIEATKTVLITRKKTLASFKEGLRSVGDDYDLLHKYEILHPLLMELEGGKSFVQKSHAKFYAGVSHGEVELLCGSFNLHEGDYAENISLRRYTLQQFFQKYLLGLNYLLLPNKLIAERLFLRVRLDEDKVRCTNESNRGAMRPFPAPDQSEEGSTDA